MTYIIFVMLVDLCRIVIKGASCLAVVIIVFSCAVVGETIAADPVLEFYCKRASAVFDAKDPIERGVNFSFIAKSYYKTIGRKGIINDIDSALTRYYFSYGHLDSNRTTVCTSDKLKNIDFSIPNIFSNRYLYNFFPNDTGGKDIAIGFDTDSIGNNQPVGLAILDRGKYVLHWLYLFYPHKSGFRRFTRSFRFAEFKGYVFPDSLWEVGVLEGVLSPDNYRLEIGIEGLEIHNQHR